MDAHQKRRFIILAATILCATVMTAACATNRSAAPDKVKEREMHGIDTLALFEEEYEAIARQVEQGSLPAQTMSKAAEVQVRLKKYLINTEAQLGILRLDVLHGDEETREAALQKMVELVAEQERTKMDAVQRLQALKGGSEQAGDKKEAKRQVKGFKIDIAPEDIATGEFP